MRFSIKQKGEKVLFNLLPSIWKESVKIGHIYHKREISVYTIDSLKSLKELIKYLKKYPLKSSKRINYQKWLKLYREIEEGGRGKDWETIKSMSQSINKTALNTIKKVEDKVQTLEKY